MPSFMRLEIPGFLNKIDCILPNTEPHSQRLIEPLAHIMMLAVIKCAPDDSYSRLRVTRPSFTSGTDGNSRGALKYSVLLEEIIEPDYLCVLELGDCERPLTFTVEHRPLMVSDFAEPSVPKNLLHPNPQRDIIRVINGGVV